MVKAPLTGAALVGLQVSFTVQVPLSAAIATPVEQVPGLPLVTEMPFPVAVIALGMTAAVPVLVTVTVAPGRAPARL